MRTKTSGFNKKYLLPKDLARHLRCSARTIREYCKKGKIPEAIRTNGRHWRIRRPFSEKTKWFFAKIRREWPFDGSSEAEGEFDSDYAELLATAIALNCDVENLLTDLGLAHRHSEKQKEIAQIEKSISDRVNAGKAFPDVRIVGAIYRFWWKHHRTPTVGEVAKEMQLSRSTFYRRGYGRIFKNAIYAVSGKVKAALLKSNTFNKDDSSASESDGFEKQDFLSIQRELNPRGLREH